MAGSMSDVFEKKVLDLIFRNTSASATVPMGLDGTNGEIGVTAETLTMSVAAGGWETLTFTQQTPSAKGWVTVRLLSRSAAATGKAFFDTVVVT
jgi:hypothetical protein